MEVLLLYVLVAFFYFYMSTKVPDDKWPISALRIAYVIIAFVFLATPFITMDVVLGNSKIEYTIAQNVTYQGTIYEDVSTDVTQELRHDGMRYLNIMLFYINAIMLLLTIGLLIFQIFKDTAEKVIEEAEEYGRS